MPEFELQLKIVGGVTYAALLVDSLFLAAVFWSCIAPDQFYHCYYDAPLVTFIPPFSGPWADPTHGKLRDFFIWSPWIVYSLWFAFTAVAVFLPALVVRLLRRHGKLTLRWLWNPAFVVSMLFGMAIVYVLSLGPVLCLAEASDSWEGWPPWVQHFYALLRSWVTPRFDTAYGQYLMWWINLQYWRHW